jgi:hypothetical protein
MHSPKIPGPTAEETRLRASQVDELARLDDQENMRVKRLTRGRTGGTLLGARSGSRSTTSGNAPGAPTTGSSPRGGGTYSIPGYPG